MHLRGYILGLRVRYDFTYFVSLDWPAGVFKTTDVSPPSRVPATARRQGFSSPSFEFQLSKVQLGRLDVSRRLTLFLGGFSGSKTPEAISARWNDSSSPLIFSCDQYCKCISMVERASSILEAGLPVQLLETWTVVKILSVFKGY
jgi:hypothetical protein